jgi:hypothetical protein
VNQVLPVGDHHLVLLRVEALSIHDALAPLVFHASAFHGLTALGPCNGQGCSAPRFPRRGAALRAAPASSGSRCLTVMIDCEHSWT